MRYSRTLGPKYDGCNVMTLVSSLRKNIAQILSRLDLGGFATIRSMAVLGSFALRYGTDGRYRKDRGYEFMSVLYSFCYPKATALDCEDCEVGGEEEGCN